MNLADAIRKAAQSQPQPVVQAVPVAVTMAMDPIPAPAQAEPEFAPISQPVVFEGLDEDTPMTAEPAFETVPEQGAPQLELSASEHVASAGTTVRLELFLTPEQLSHLFRAVAANQHSMMTLREAAALLRVPAHSLEQMAQEGDIPGFLIDGRWRFSKSAIEEWLTQRQPRKETA